MIICEKCFRDAEIISVIRSKEIIGDCPLCKSKGVYVYDTDLYEELSMMFDEFLGIYTPTSLLPDSYPKSDIRLLKSELINNWSIFSEENEVAVYDIITSLCKEKVQNNYELFTQPVGIAELYDDIYLGKHSLLGTRSWDDFVEMLKTKNRFHTHYIDLKLLERFCSYVRKSYKRGDVFYRGRISTEKGFSKDKMGAPPLEKSIEGRANAKGIQCLYLGDTPETTIYETRASVYDCVTVGTFRLKEDITIVDLKQINKISPFIEELDCLEYAVNKECLNKINSEVSKITRRSDSTLEYVPTQYVTDFIKSIMHNGEAEYSGIEYKSVMNSNGYNLAIFYPELFECVDTKVYMIETVDYKKRGIGNCQ